MAESISGLFLELIFWLVGGNIKRIDHLESQITTKDSNKGVNKFLPRRMEKGEKFDAVLLRANLPTGRANSHYTLSPIQVRFHLELNKHLTRYQFSYVIKLFVSSLKNRKRKPRPSKNPTIFNIIRFDNGLTE